MIKLCPSLEPIPDPCRTARPGYRGLAQNHLLEASHPGGDADKPNAPWRFCRSQARISFLIRRNVPHCWAFGSAKGISQQQSSGLIRDSPIWVSSVVAAAIGPKIGGLVPTSLEVHGLYGMRPTTLRDTDKSSNWK
jgi:hypothetical protein